MPARILIVDDNVALTENLRDILEGSPELDAEVTVVANGQDATRIAKRDGFDVAVVDIKLPDGNGVNVVRHLRAASPFGEVVLITGFATVDSAIAALQAGAFAFLLKSFRPEELLATVEQACAKAHLKREREILEQRQRALIETAGVLIVALDAENRVALSNPKVAELTLDGIPIAVGKSFLENWVSEDDHGRMTRALNDAREGSGTVEVEAAFVDGAQAHAPRRVHWHWSAVRTSRGQADLVYGIGLDVTERRALERRAAEAEALSAMGSLALGLAHEIRNPLNAAVLQLHLLGRSIDRLGGDAKGSMQDRVAIVEGEIRRLERLLTEFLELARPRAVHFRRVDLGQLVRAVLELEGAALTKQGITLHTELASGIYAKGDPEKLKQVLINLVANARDAMREGGTFTVRVGADTETTTLDLIDDGPGIEPDVLRNVFDPFFTTKEAGTGLGLAIVRKIVDRHGGTIRLASTVGQGTHVALRFPRGPRAIAKKRRTWSGVADR